MEVHYWEEPVFETVAAPELRVKTAESGTHVCTPILPHGVDAGAAQKILLDRYVEDQISGDLVAWYYTPMALGFSEHLAPEIVVYDCMDELSAFMGAPPMLIEWEQRLFERADVVFTGGASLYEAKRGRHRNVHLFASSVDKEHFASARRPQADSPDQANIPHPRIGFFGVLDERLDVELLRELAAQHTEWHFVLIGPVVKIGEDQLPQAENIHYLGQKDYKELPRYIAQWEAAMLPFAKNASTRFISPTKTPEYLAAGRRVVSTDIQDVARPYGELGLVEIARNATEFSGAIARSLKATDEEWLSKVDLFLSQMSWDQTVQGMLREIEACALRTSTRSAAPIPSIDRVDSHV